MANRNKSHRRARVAVLMVLCSAVFAAFFARLAWMQFVKADYYADKAAEASSEAAKKAAEATTEAAEKATEATSQAAEKAVEAAAEAAGAAEKAAGKARKKLEGC